MLPTMKIASWDWSQVCSSGAAPWSPANDAAATTSNSSAASLPFAPCVQQLFLQLPALAVFAILSAYQCGTFSVGAPTVRRDRVQYWALQLRRCCVWALAIVPVARLYYAFTVRHSAALRWTDSLVAGAELLAYAVHAVLLSVLLRRGPTNHRGSLGVRVVWIIVFMLTVIGMQSDKAAGALVAKVPLFGAVAVFLHVLYGCTLVPKGEAQRVSTGAERGNESLLGPNRYSRFRDDHDELALGHAQDDAGRLSGLFFVWVNPLIKKGVAGYLQRIDDLFTLPACLDVSRLADAMRASLAPSGRLFGALHRAHGCEFYAIGVLRLMADMAGFAGPLLLGGLLSHAVASDDDATVHGDGVAYLYALGLFAAALIAAICGTHFNWRMSLVAMKMRIGLVTAIYTKALDARQLHDARPDVLNLMSTDTDRIVNSCASFHSFWSIPVQLVVTLYLLYRQIGVAFVAGVVFAAALIPLNRLIAVRIGVYSERLMGAKDARIGVATETLTNAKSIKLAAWEDVFCGKINACRDEELRYLAKRKYLDALCVYFWATTPVLMSALTFGTSVLLGRKLEAAGTFTTVALLNMLIGPLNAFPWVLNGLVEAWISLRRVQELLDLPNIDYDHFYTLPDQRDNVADAQRKPSAARVVVELHHATLRFDHERRRDSASGASRMVTDFHLADAQLRIREGELVCVAGATGGGKSALLDALLGHLHLQSGEVRLEARSRERLGYVAQSAWLQRGTVRENIVWGAIYDEQRYKRVLHACALVGDLNAMGGDQLGIGEGGQTLSGGQKARVALARAVYQDKDVYLLDDVLAALDVHVAQHIVQYCLLGLLRHKTRICITENEALHRHADRIVHIADGRLQIVHDAAIDGSSESLADPEPSGDDDDEDAAIPVDQLQLNESVVELSSVDSVLVEETKETGSLSADVFRAYGRAMGCWWGAAVLVAVVVMQATRNVSDVWLAHWVSKNVSGYSEHAVPLLRDVANAETAEFFYLEVYGALAAFNSMVTLLRAFVFAYAGLRAARFMHERMLNSVLYAKFQFFDITPLGRILNRFSSDTYTIDDTLPFILNVLLAQLAALLGSITVTLFAQPWLGLLIVPLAPVYHSLQSRYRHAARDIRRLASNALSPLYAHFTETLQGLRTIRAMGARPRFRRDFHGKLEECTRAQLTAAAAQQWLAVRLQLMGALVVGGCGLVAAATGAHASSPGLVGLAVAYALSITGQLGGVLSAAAETEQELIAVERVGKYCRVEPEHNADGTAEAPYGWPCQGVVVFRAASLRYREYAPMALDECTLTVDPGERVGVAGRTGAGKTSLLGALFRVAPLQAGLITVDAVDVATLPLRVLRSRMALVTQQAFLFGGTVRENMDPRGFHLDSKIWSALGECMATQVVQSLGGLSGRVVAGGRNVSAGQKQLLCLARALLKNSKVVCIDEGTANLDADSEATIQRVLRTAFRTATVILVAHRISSLQNADRVVVMQAGRIVEQGAVSELADDEASVFRAMLENRLR